MISPSVWEVSGNGQALRGLRGNNVSHAHNVTKKVWLPNLQRVRAKVGSSVRRIRVCTRCIRSNRIQKAAS